MSAKNESIVRAMVDAIRNADKSKTSPYDTQATVRRVENGVAWVHIPGGVDETPVKLTIAAAPGDVVQVRVAGGRAFLVGNATAPPTDDTTAKRAVTQIGAVSKVVKTVQRIAEQAARIAGNTNQYFWHTQEGTDTGAHITEIPQDEFLADPANGGGNLLARSNGLALRIGLTELVRVMVSGIQIGRDDEVHSVQTSTGTTFYDENGIARQEQTISDTHGFSVWDVFHGQTIRTGTGGIELIGSFGNGLKIDTFDTVFTGEVEGNPYLLPETEYVPSAVTVHSGQITSLCDITLEANSRYLIVYGAAFATNSTGYRKLHLGINSNTAGRYSPVVRAVEGEQTRLNATLVYTNTSSGSVTLHLWAQQNSGSDLATYGYAYAIKI